MKAWGVGFRVEGLGVEGLNVWGGGGLKDQEDTGPSRWVSENRGT